MYYNTVTAHVNIKQCYSFLYQKVEGRKKKHNPQPHSNVDRILVCFHSKSKIWRVNHPVLPFTEYGRGK